MRVVCLVAVVVCLAGSARAQLTADQKIADFHQLAGLYAKNYAPYELKRDLFGFDLYNLQPWLDRINQSKSDLEFYDILTRYVASLQDSHDEFLTPSDFDAWLHFDGDIYDGKFLIDYIDRSYLPSRSFGFHIGDELVMVDGVAVSDLIKQFGPYSVNGSSNPVSRDRIAAATITERYQGWYPLATQIGATAEVVVQHPDGLQSTYKIPWDIIGTAVTQNGPVPTAKLRTATSSTFATRVARRYGAPGRLRGESGDRGSAPNPWGVWSGPPAPAQPDNSPVYMQPLQQLRHLSALRPAVEVSGLVPFDSLFPTAFNPPDGFVLRLGSRNTDEFVSGYFHSAGKTLGYIRIPSFTPSSASNAIQQFADEMAYFQTHTDGLMVDVMANGGGDGCYAQDLASLLIPTTFQGLSQQLRATLYWQTGFSSALTYAKDLRSPQWVIDLYTAYLAEIQEALASNRGMTGSLPMCGVSLDAQPSRDPDTGAIRAYTKPILVLTDNFTMSAAEVFTAFLQDSHRATIFGTRTSGGGGNVASFAATDYSEGQTRVTLGLITRPQAVAVPGFPSMIYYDGVGIYPDIIQDAMTTGDLINGGQTFFSAATSALIGLLTQ